MTSASGKKTRSDGHPARGHASVQRAGPARLARQASEWCRREERYGAGEGAFGYPRGSSWTRCPDRFLYDLPTLGGPSYAVVPYDDDRGFRCIRRGEGRGASAGDSAR